MADEPKIAEQLEPAKVAVQISPDVIVSWYNRLVNLFIAERMPPDPALVQAIGLLYCSQMKQFGFQFSEAQRAFKNMWALNAMSTDGAPPQEEGTKGTLSPVGEPQFGVPVTGTPDPEPKPEES